VGVFGLFVGIAYNQGGEAFGQMLDARGKDVLEEFQEMEQAEIVTRTEEITACETALEVYSDLQCLDAAEADLFAKVAAATNIAAQKKLNGEMTALLDMLVANKEKIESQMQAALVQEVTAEVTAMFASDDKLKKSVLDSALGIIAAPGTPAKSDPVKDAFAGILKKKAEAMKGKVGTTEALDAAYAKKVADEVNQLLDPYFTGDFEGTDEQLAWVKSQGIDPTETAPVDKPLTQKTW
jgi:hypothetical protein